MSVGEGEREGVELEKAEEGVGGSDGDMGKEFDGFGSNVLGGFNLEEVRGMRSLI